MVVESAVMITHTKTDSQSVFVCDSGFDFFDTAAAARACNDQLMYNAIAGVTFIDFAGTPIRLRFHCMALAPINQIRSR